jgi:hypothetical protein
MCGLLNVRAYLLRVSSQDLWMVVWGCRRGVGWAVRSAFTSLEYSLLQFAYAGTEAVEGFRKTLPVWRE